MIDLLLITGIFSHIIEKNKNYLNPITYTVPIASIYEDLKNDFEIKIFIPSIFYDNYLNLIPEAKIYGFSIAYSEIVEAKKICNFIKNKYPNSKIVFGGQYVTSFPEETFKYIENLDYIVRGHGSEAIRNLLNNTIYTNISTRDNISQIIYNRYDINISNIEDKNSFIGIDWNEIDNNDYCFKGERWLVTNHGCAFNCSFCTNKYLTDAKILYRNPDKIIKEINDMISIDENIIIMLTEPTFNTKNKQYRQYAYNLLNNIYHKTEFSRKNTLGIFCKISNIDDEFIDMMDKFKDKITYNLLPGVENFNDEILKDMNKIDTKSNMLNVFERLKNVSSIKSIFGNIILGTPKDDDDKFYENLNTMILLKESYKNSGINLEINTTPLWLLPGSLYYERKNLYKDIFIQENDPDKQIRILEYNGKKEQVIGLKDDWFIKFYKHKLEWYNTLSSL